MSKATFLCIALLAAACAPTLPPPTAPPAAIGAEAGATLAAAQAQATRAAQVIEAATAEAKATAEAYAFAVTQTANALNAEITRQAVEATGAAIAIQQTQDAQAAQIEIQITARGATESAARAGLEATEQAGESARRELRANFYSYLVPTAAAVLALLTLAAAWLLFREVQDRMHFRASLHETASGGIVQMIEGEWRPIALIEAPPPARPPTAPQANPAETEAVRREKWRMAVTLFCFYGNQDATDEGRLRSGFALRRMTAEKIVADPGWRVITGLLVEAHVLLSDGAGTRWTEEWSYPRFRAELRHGRLSLPYPPGEPPEVRRPQHTHAPHAQNAPHTAYAAEAAP